MSGWIPEYQKAHARGRPRMGPGRYAGGILLRGVVQKVYRPVDLPADNVPEHARRGITCHVLILGGRGIPRTILPYVPLVNQAGGLNDGTDWIPRETTQALSGNLDVAGSGGQATPADQMDGDNVLIGFLDGDLAFPVILGAMNHPSRRSIYGSEADDTARRRIRFQGVVVEITDDGSINVDTSGASSGELTLTGEEGDGIGDVVVTTKGDLALGVGRDTTLTTESLSVDVEGAEGDVEYLLSGGGRFRVKRSSGGTPLRLCTKELIDALAPGMRELVTVLQALGLGAAIPTLTALALQLETSQSFGAPYLTRFLESE